MTTKLIQSGANVLLTFTNIRNEVGRGNDIFNQATGLALDMSVALGHDLASSNIQLGKALNDPIKGITALQRVGVAFTEQQKEQITTLVESGDTARRPKDHPRRAHQRVRWVSAEAQATASDKMKVAFGNLQEEIGTRLLPLVEAFSTWMTEKGIPKIGEFADWIEETLIPALGQIKTWVEDNVSRRSNQCGGSSQDVLPIFQAVAAFINDTLVPAFGSLAGALGGSNDEAENTGPSWQGWLRRLGSSVATVGGILAKLGLLGPAIKGIVGTVGVIFVSAWRGIISTLPFAHILVLVALFRGRIVDLLTSAWQAITGLFTQGQRLGGRQVERDVDPDVRRRPPMVGRGIGVLR